MISSKTKQQFFFFLFAFLSLNNLQAQNVLGTWQGKLNILGKNTRLVFHVKQDSAKNFIGTMDSPEQGVKGLEADEVFVTDDSLYMFIPKENIEYSGNYDKVSNTYSGLFRQGGAKIHLKLFKGDAEDLLYKRPQKPLPPYPYHEEEVSVINTRDGDTLAGTLTKPNGKGKFPVAIMITGSGPEDRDETVFAHKPFLVLADYLTRKGFAVLRCDDRGTAKSTGVFPTATPENFARDAEAQIAFLKTRSDIDLKKIGLIGHSEGGIIAQMVAARNKDVAFIVMLAGPAIDMFDLLLMQDSLTGMADGETDATINKALAINKKLFALLKTSNDSTTIADKIDSCLSAEHQSDREILSAIKELTNTWMRWYVGFDPHDNLKKLNCPVLAINGEKDVQVPAAVDIASIQETLTKSGNKNFKTEIIPGLNHVFQKCTKCSVGEYLDIEETMNPLALAVIGDWMEKNFLAKK